MDGALRRPRPRSTGPNEYPSDNGTRRSCAAARGADIAARCPYHAKQIPPHSRGPFPPLFGGSDRMRAHKRMAPKFSFEIREDSANNPRSFDAAVVVSV